MDYPMPRPFCSCIIFFPGSVKQRNDQRLRASYGLQIYGYYGKLRESHKPFGCVCVIETFANANANARMVRMVHTMV